MSIGLGAYNHNRNLKYSCIAQVTIINNFLYYLIYHSVSTKLKENNLLAAIDAKVNY